MISFETKKHGTLQLRTVTVDELTQLMFNLSVSQALQNLCQRGEVMKDGKQLLIF